MHKKNIWVCILISILILVAAQTVSVLIASAACAAGLPVPAGNILAALLYAALALWGIRVLGRKGLKMRPSSLGLSPVRIRPAWGVAAVLLPLAVCGICLLLPGHFEAVTARQADVVLILSGAAYYGIAAAVVEEAVFRGAILKSLESRWNRKVAVLASSVLFGAVHMLGASLSLVSAVQLLLAGTAVGILFALIAYESGSIWSGALGHGVWNLFMVSQILHIGPEADASSIFSYVLEVKNPLLTGGDFGIEASVIAMMAYAGLAAVAYSMIRRKRLKR